ncbi:MAG TPA: hypothetical protein GX519_07610 [Thermoanaerobacterales bacterium]|nr:hypothetical protein [Thermoanaerobacterales bacterium]
MIKKNGFFANPFKMEVAQKYKRFVGNNNINQKKGDVIMYRPVIAGLDVWIVRSIVYCISIIVVNIVIAMRKNNSRIGG